MNDIHGLIFLITLRIHIFIVKDSTYSTSVLIEIVFDRQ